MQMFPRGHQLISKRNRTPQARGYAWAVSMAVRRLSQDASPGTVHPAPGINFSEAMLSASPADAMMSCWLPVAIVPVHCMPPKKGLPNIADASAGVRVSQYIRPGWQRFPLLPILISVRRKRALVSCPYLKEGENLA